MRFPVAGRSAYAYVADHPPDAKRRSVVFVHGAGLDHSWFALQSRYFGYHGRNVLAVDLPGHGRSPGPPLGAIEQMADWVAALLDAAGLGRAAVVGHSMGSLVALEFAARYPERAEAIALIGTGYPMTVSEHFLRAAAEDHPTAYDMSTVWGHAARVPFASNPNPGMWMYGDTLARLSRLAPGVLYADLKACDGYAGGREAASRVRCPALLLLGARDVMTPPRAAAMLAEALAGVRTVTLDCGHALMAEAPDAVLDTLIAFLPH